MALPTEDKSNDVRRECMICCTALNIKVLPDDDGYYVGYVCPLCGPYSRESRYYPNREEAQSALNLGIWNR
jgi:hypothetical protein